MQRISKLGVTRIETIIAAVRVKEELKQGMQEINAFISDIQVNTKGKERRNFVNKK